MSHRQEARKAVSDLEVDDAIILLMGAPTRMPNLANRLEGITRLEKLMFLLSKETELSDLMGEDMEFTAHNFGPFSSKIYQMIDVLAAAGLVEDSSKAAKSNEESWESSQLIGDGQDRYSTRNFKLTERGSRYYSALTSELPEDAENVVSRFKEKFGALPLRQLIRYVYKKYPEYTENSLIKDQFRD